ncbi:hypothetical protein OIV83_001119 [Microbotryomycetes sp. JL201]|nr:hypothetical protein OIV83_001119 [Microbotryomycetes sp. JL201]
MATHVFAPLPHNQDNGAEITRLFREGGPGTTVLLLQQATYTLTTSIDFSHSNTTLATEGYPDFETGMQSVLETRGDKEAGAVNMFNKNNCALKRVHIRGCRGWGRNKPESKEEEDRLRQQGKLGWIEGGGAMVWMGGPDSHDSIVEGCRLEDPRGWTSVHVCDFAVRTRVINNIVGPCGQQFPGGPWADGLSIAGKDSLIAGNTVTDATDGAIVVFCAPGTTVTNNTIIAKTRDLLGAINMVDDFPFAQDFTNTRVTGNVIKTEGDAFIRLGIGCGPTCWSPWQPGHTLNFGGYVLDNYIGPGNLAYGIALSGVRNFTVQGNAVVPGTQFTGNMDKVLWNAPPMPFLRQWADRNRVQDCEVQSDFVEGEASYLIGADPGFGERIIFNGGQLKMDVSGKTVSGDGGVKLKGARWEVSRRGELLLREIKEDVLRAPMGTGKVLWSSGGQDQDVEHPILRFDAQGGLSIKSNGGDGQVLWDATSYLRPFLDKISSQAPLRPKPEKEPNWPGHPSAIFANKAPFLEIKSSDDDLLYSTSYEYGPNDNWSLHSGHWIAIAPQALRGFVPHNQGVASLSLDEFITPGGRPLGEQQPPVDPEQHHFAQPPPPPQQHQHRGHGLSSFVRDLGSSLQKNFDAFGNDNVGSGGGHYNPYPGHAPRPDQCPVPPPIPARPPHLSSSSSNPALNQPTFLFLNPKTAQLQLHSSACPTHPEPSLIHWQTPAEPVPENEFEQAWFSMQVDSNAVLYVKKPNGELWVPWASHTGGQDLRLKLKAKDEKDGPGLELINKQGDKVWSSTS